MTSNGMAEAVELAEMVDAYERLRDRINAQCSGYKVVYVAALAENLRRLHLEAEKLETALNRRKVLMAW